MTTVELQTTIAQLPPAQQQLVAAFVAGLQAQQLTSAAEVPFTPTPHDLAIRRQQGFGHFKGQIKMSDDFDEPLDDFKEYM